MNSVLLLLASLFLLHVIRNVLYSLLLWQRKEYRFDRMLIHLTTQTGRKWMFGKISLIKWILLLLYCLLPGLRDEAIPVLLVYLAESFLIFREWKHGIKKPIVTAKIAFIMIATLFLLSFSSIRITPFPFALLIVDKLLPFFVGFLVLLVSVPVSIVRYLHIRRATQKITAQPQLIRIGITGSYGKSSTKEFLAAILAKKYQVVATEKSYNTDIGIARTITTAITPSTHVFIAEMGAYKVGEIAALCKMVQPTIGIITGLNEQHLELFGSIAKTRQAKYELIQALPSNGLAVFNGDNENTRAMALETKHVPVLCYGTAHNNDIVISHVAQTKDTLVLTVSMGNKNIHLRAPLLGIQYAQNIAAAVAVSDHLGISEAAIHEAIEHLTTLPQTMHKVGQYQGATLIDDTFNANPTGVLAAIEYTKVYTGKKYVILTPLIELGTEASRLHEEIGVAAATTLDGLLATNSMYAKELSAAAQKQHKKELVQVCTQPQAVEFLRKNLAADGVAVFIGKESHAILESLRNSHA